MNRERTTQSLRRLFLDFFVKKAGHTEVPSSSLIPGNDPTLLFTNAGMVQFKDVFLGAEKRPYTRATTAQKCLRVSGKHNDLENVGRTKRHHTFFEMMGNFSFGDYFKEEAIHFAWELITRELDFPADRLWPTVFREDDEAAGLWRKISGLPDARILRFDEKDNFWSMGETGPCGPCSEVLFDRGGEGPEDPRVNDERYTEFWNIVFMQYDRDAAGKMTPLPRPSIDTGLGLERLATIVQGVDSNWDNDLFRPLCERAAELAGKRYITGPAGHSDDRVSMRVIADHARATAFLIADGVVPGNVERNYVLRRIMRRAIRHGERLGLNEPFFHEVCQRVVEVMGGHYRELDESRDHIAKVVQIEEEQFRRTLRTGLKLLERQIADVKESGGKEVPGDVVFFLHDTHGFPPDLTAVIAGEHGLGVGDPEKFRPKGSEGLGGAASAEAYRAIGEKAGAPELLFYETTDATGVVTGLLDANGAMIGAASAGQDVQVVTNRTPFYGESGGQVGDTGALVGPAGDVEVTDTRRPLPGLIVHVGRVRAGTLKVGDPVTAKVNAERRAEIMRNHSATHLMHWALRKTLGKHVRQAGSVVEPERLRFDFNHYQKVSADDLRTIEKLVNAEVLRNALVQKQEMGFAEAQERGALAFFGDKYGDRVRVVEMGPSVELCGGTHVVHTGDIGLFRFTQETASSAGVRRVEAVTGIRAVEAAQDAERELADAAVVLGVRPGEVARRVERLLAELKETARERDALKRAKAAAGAGDLLAGMREAGGVKVLAAQVDVVEPAELRDLGDKVLAKMGGEGVLLLAGVAGEKVALLARVSAGLVKRFQAGGLVQKLAPIVGGKGGGRPDLAQGGGTDPTKVEDAFKLFYDLTTSG